jgi:inorganic pyrophosphatase
VRLLHLIALAVPGLLAVQVFDRAPAVLPEVATGQLARSLSLAEGHSTHVWRDTTPLNDDGTVNAYVEIPRGDTRKWEFDMRANARAIDRVMPPDVGGYPVNYGFVPQTISYDGDPFDALVLGPPLPGGQMVRGAIVGVIFMDDEKGHDAKVVLSAVDGAGRPTHVLTAGDQQRIGEYFRQYKRHDAGAFSRVSGWGSAGQGRSYVLTTHAFFEQCRHWPGQACRLPR